VRHRPHAIAKPRQKRRFYLDAIDRAAYVGGTAAAQEVVGLEKRKKWGSVPSGQEYTVRSESRPGKETDASKR
jgi:hypothetical protein